MWTSVFPDVRPDPTLHLTQLPSAAALGRSAYEKNAAYMDGTGHESLFDRCSDTMRGHGPHLIFYRQSWEVSAV